MTPEKREAQERLQEAIEHHCRVWTPDEDVPESGEMLADWVVVMHLVSYDKDGDENAAYRLGFSNGQMADHRAIGLLDFAVHLVKFGTNTSRSDGEE